MTNMLHELQEKAYKGDENAMVKLAAEYINAGDIGKAVTLEQLCGYFESARADTCEEALALLEKDLKHNQRIDELRDHLRQAQDDHDAMVEEVEEMRWERASAEQAENRARWAELEEEMKYTYNSY